MKSLLISIVGLLASVFILSFFSIDIWAVIGDGSLIGGFLGGVIFSALKDKKK